jgi:mono/diheme cytochrome c family protein
MKPIIIFLLSAFVLGCSQNSDHASAGITVDSETGRWYSKQQMYAGRKLFNKNCAVCHGEKARGTTDWKTPDSNGVYPPPPLNGSAHAWHHPLSVLYQVIQFGGAPMGGTMPAWQGKLNEQETLAVIAGFQSEWSDEIYAKWLQRELASRQQN